MKNKLEKIDNLFKKSLEDYKQTPPNDLFEKALKESNVEKSNFFHLLNIKYLSVLLIPIIAILLWNLLLLQEPKEMPKLTEQIAAQSTAKSVKSCRSEHSNKPATIVVAKKSSNTIVGTTTKGMSDPIIQKNAKGQKPDENSYILDHLITKAENTIEPSTNQLVSNIVESNIPLIQSNAILIQSTTQDYSDQNIKITSENNDPEKGAQTLNPQDFGIAKPIIKKTDSLTTAEKTIDINPGLKKIDWSVELFGFGSAQLQSTKSKKAEFNNFVDNKEKAFTPSFSSYNYGVLVGINKGPFSFQAGISYSKLNEMNNYGNVCTNPKQISYLSQNATPYNYVNNNNYYRIDSSQYWHYTYISNPNVQAIDSVLALDIDTALVNNFDTIKTIVYDTLNLSQLKVQYSLIEFPIWIGYERIRQNARWGYAFRVGITPAMMVRQQGSFFDGESLIKISPDTYPLRKFLLYGSLKASIIYNINHHLEFSFGPEAKTTLFSVSSSQSGWTQRWSSVGIHFGIKYYLNR